MLLKRRHANKPQVYERHCTQQITRKMQIKTTMRYHLIPVRVATLNKTKDKCGGCEGKRTFVHCWWQCKFGAVSIEYSLELPQIIKWSE